MKSKSVIAIILTIIIGVIPLTALSDVTYSVAPVYDDEIRFQGLEWGSSPTQVEQKLAELGFDPEATRQTRQTCDYYYMLMDGYYEDDSWDELPGVKYDEWFRTVPRYRTRFQGEHSVLCTVAGHNVSHIITTYLPTYDMDQFTISKNTDDMRIMRIEYGFYNTNKRLATYDVFTDLLGKLTKLYGTPTSIEPRHDIYSKYEAYVWYGKNNTMVHLEFYKLDSWGSYDTVDLTYGFAGDYEDVKNVYTIFTTKKKNAEDAARDYELDKVQDDYDGL